MAALNGHNECARVLLGANIRSSELKNSVSKQTTRILPSYIGRPSINVAPPTCDTKYRWTWMESSESRSRLDSGATHLRFGSQASQQVGRDFRLGRPTGSESHLASPVVNGESSARAVAAPNGRGRASKIRVASFIFSHYAHFVPSQVGDHE